MKLENLVLTQEAYITGEHGKEYFEALAEDINGNDYLVIWDIKAEYKDMLNEIDDESMLCDWDNPSDIRKI